MIDIPMMMDCDDLSTFIKYLFVLKFHTTVKTDSTC